VIAALAILLSGVSLLVVQGARDEPYAVYRRYDALVQVRVGAGLMVLWGCVVAGVAGLMMMRRVSLRWVGLVIWGVVCLFYLRGSVVGYLEDVERFGVLHEDVVTCSCSVALS
jgi:hypothetical protein